MKFPENFICASEEKNEYENHLCAPFFRKIFTLNHKKNTSLLICGLGFYRAFLNGKEITKGKRIDASTTG